MISLLTFTPPSPYATDLDFRGFDVIYSVTGTLAHKAMKHVTDHLRSRRGQAGGQLHHVLGERCAMLGPGAALAVDHALQD
jgi:hypothetical protein